jgi:antitoxin ParD1/3/4
VNITLTPELEKAVAEKVSSGGYADESQFVCEILQETLIREKKQNALLQAELQIGLDQLDRGEGILIESKEQFLEMVRAR